VLGPEEPIGNRQSEIGNEQTAPGSDVCGATIMSYLYDPEGRRVARLQGGAVVKQCFYDAGGRMIAEADPSGRTLRAEIYGGNRHLATWTPASGGSTFFNHADWLGTERARTRASDGSRCETITSLPFGDGLNATGPCSNPEPGPNHFTGKERDYESNLDYFGARYFGGGNALGRFMTADPLGQGAADPGAPQTWNAYAYAGNNPTTNTDPTGETHHICQTDSNGNQSNCTDISDQQFGQFQQENKDTLTFTGNGNVLQNGTVIGSYQQTSVDLSPFASDVIAGVNANHPGDFIAGVAGASLIAGTGVGLGLYATTAGAGLTTLGLQAAPAIAPLLPAVPSAITKLQRNGETVSGTFYFRRYLFF
jgi:RHS repeat-associated protein